MTLFSFMEKELSNYIFIFREALDKRIEVIESQIEATESSYDKEKL